MSLSKKFAVAVVAGAAVAAGALPASAAPESHTQAIIRYTVPNLPSKNVRAVFQDSDGWMWFGTDKGIARFNGAEFKSSVGAGSMLFSSMKSALY